MVCESCQKHLRSVCVPDKWKSEKQTTDAGSLKPGKTNKILGKLKQGNSYVPDKSNCRICKSKVQLGMNYCNDCAHKKGLCARCGKKTIDTSMHKMSLV